MSYGLYLSADGVCARQREWTPLRTTWPMPTRWGSSGRWRSFRRRYAEQTARGSDSPGSGSVNDMGGGVIVQETRTDFSPGPMKRTESPTDVAIGGEGFFVVQKNGQQYLTRAGNFRLTEQGKLVTQQNYPVLNASGSPIAIDPTKGRFEITPDGQVRQDGDAQTWRSSGPHRRATWCGWAKTSSGRWRQRHPYRKANAGWPPVIWRCPAYTRPRKWSI